jgi:hypothetical protein
MKELETMVNLWWNDVKEQMTVGEFMAGLEMNFDTVKFTYDVRSKQFFIL